MKNIFNFAKRFKRKITEEQAFYQLWEYQRSIAQSRSQVNEIDAIFERHLRENYRPNWNWGSEP